MYYIQETDKPVWLKRKLNIINIQDNKLILPITNQQNLTEKQAKKLSEKTAKILLKNNNKKVVLSKKVKSEKNYLNYLYTYNLEIPNGKWLFEVLSYDIIDYIVKIKHIKKEETQIAILVNYISEYTLGNIKRLIKNFKRVNIVTNNFSKFKNIEKNILDEYGIMITVTNNKKKSLMRSKIILNIDFPTELINKYNIYEDAIIVNVCSNVKINKKRFNGININNYEIKSQSYFYDLHSENTEHSEYTKQVLSKYSFKDIYESGFYKKQPYEDVIRKIKKDGVFIEKLYGTNSVL